MELFFIVAMPVVVPFIVVILITGIKVVNEYERGIVLTLGKFTGLRTGGLRFIVPIFQKMTRVDMRIGTVDIPQQEVISKDNVPLNINAVVYYQVEDAQKAVLNIQNFSSAVADFSQVALCDVVGGFELDAILSEREIIASKIKEIVDHTTETWGINITAIKLQDIELPADMKRIMAKQAESERERRAVIIRAEGELEASKKLSEAAKILAATDGGMAMRTLQTIEKSSGATIYALPIEVITGLGMIGKKSV
jgi:regulator of protease activity HflC (stomatin/prohibitin superfamily)